MQTYPDVHSFGSILIWQDKSTNVSYLHNNDVHFNITIGVNNINCILSFLFGAIN